MVYAPNKRADQDEAFLAAEVGKLVDQTVKADSVLGRVATHHGTAAPPAWTSRCSSTRSALASPAS